MNFFSRIFGFFTLPKEPGSSVIFQRVSLILVGLFAFLGCWVISLLQGIPSPQVTDEFSYLLAADTFAHGRLTNPSHPMWIHFESMHILQQPTYMSKYPPAPGLVLALGQVLFGHPVYGVWIGMALMCAGICWMLQAWVSPRAALLGGFLAILHPVFGIHGYWAQSYWGGAIPAFGGILFFGGVRRIFQNPENPSIRDSLIAGLGLALLANSRPFEGAISVFPFIVLLLYRMMANRKKGLFKALALKVVLPLGIIVIMTLGLMAFYNHRVTGDYRVMPHTKYDREFLACPVFKWEEPRTVIFRHDRIKAYSDKMLNFGQMNQSRKGFASFWSYLSFVFGQNVYVPNSFFLAPLLASLFLFFRKDLWGIFACFTLGFLFLVHWLCLFIPIHMHYLAPVLGLYFVLLAYGFQILYSIPLARLKNVLKIFLWLVFAGMVLTPHTWIYGRSGWADEREKIIRGLTKIGGKHLVFVNYDRHCSPLVEWVYNAADIDSSPVVWAHWIDTIKNQKIMDYFNDRQVWLLTFSGKVENNKPPPLIPVKR